MSGAIDVLALRDSFELNMQKGLMDNMGLVGFGYVEVVGSNGIVKSRDIFKNLVTDVGDLWCAQQLIKTVAPAAAGAPSIGLVTCMKLGSNSGTAPSKSGAGAALGAYITGTNLAFDATYPQTANLGAGLGVTAVFKTTWTSGTISSIVEAVISASNTNAAGTAADIISRTTFATQNKGTSDTFAITWALKQLGA